jgi:ABC-2 type transport system permease protein
MTARIYALEAKYELVKLIRLPAFLIPTLGFPVMFYVLFGLLMNARGPATTYLVATYGAFGVIGIALFGIGAGVATERGQGWLSVKRASPMPISAYFIGKYVTTIVLSAVLIAILAVFAIVFGHVHLTVTQWLTLLAAETLGAIPFCAAGLAVGYLAGPNSAIAVINAIHLPTAFLSGLFIPAEMLPSYLQKFAHWLPQYHLAHLGLAAIGMESAADARTNILVLAIFGIAFTALGVFAYRRDDGAAYG